MLLFFDATLALPLSSSTLDTVVVAAVAVVVVDVAVVVVVVLCPNPLGVHDRPQKGGKGDGHLIFRPTKRQTDRQTSRTADMQTYGRTDRHHTPSTRRKAGSIHRQTGRQTRQTNKQTGRQTHRQTDKQTDRHTVQTDTQTDRQTESTHLATPHRALEQARCSAVLP